MVGIVVALVIGSVSSVEAAQWTRQYIQRLPYSAFAAIETLASGKAVRHLPHHDARGALDVPHLCNALARLPQVKWRDPANAEIARQHLQEHVRQLGGSPCRSGNSHICRKWTGSRGDGLNSLWRTPVPAVMRWTSPGWITDPVPRLSLCSSAPSST